MIGKMGLKRSILHRYHLDLTSDMWRIRLHITPVDHSEGCSDVGGKMAVYLLFIRKYRGMYKTLERFFYVELK